MAVAITDGRPVAWIPPALGAQRGRKHRCLSGFSQFLLAGDILWLSLSISSKYRREKNITMPFSSNLLYPLLLVFYPDAALQLHLTESFEEGSKLRCAFLVAIALTPPQPPTTVLISEMDDAIWRIPATGSVYQSSETAL